MAAVFARSAAAFFAASLAAAADLEAAAAASVSCLDFARALDLEASIWSAFLEMAAAAALAAAVLDLIEARAASALFAVADACDDLSFNAEAVSFLSSSTLASGDVLDPNEATRRPRAATAASPKRA